MIAENLFCKQIFTYRIHIFFKGKLKPCYLWLQKLIKRMSIKGMITFLEIFLFKIPN